MLRSEDRRRLIVAALTVCVAGSLLVSASASAYLRSFTIRTDSTNSNSNANKRGLVPVTGCPGPIFGGAAFVSPQLPNLGLQTVMPFGGLLYGAAETDSESANWKVNARAFCAQNTATPPPVGGAAFYFKAVQAVGKFTPNNSSAVKTLVVKCPPGKTAITGGAWIRSSASDHAIQSMQRVQTGDAWRVMAREVDASSANWDLLSMAICANISTETATNDYVGNGLNQQFNPPTGFDSASPKTLTRTCPAGQFVVGGGARVSGNGFDDPAPDSVVITRSSTFGPGQSNRWVAEARETDPTGASWRLNAHVTCAPMNGGPPA